MTQTPVLIYANGDLNEIEWVRPYLAKAQAVIAADGGSQHLRVLDRPPDVLIGDLDSAPEDDIAWLKSAGCQVITHPAAKEETDLELALLYANEHYPAAEILIFAALGGRLDQTLANILLLAHPAVCGRRVSLIQQHQRAWLVGGESVIQGQSGDLVSLIPLGGQVHIKYTAGLRWSLEDEPLDFGPARGVSNIMIGPLARIVVRDGQLLCIHTNRDWGR